MSGVLDALASYVTNMLTEMANEEVAMLIGVSSGINDLAIKLQDLKNFLADADRRNITEESVRVWVEELKHAMYDATDILDLCQLKVIEHGPSKDVGCLNPLLFCMRNPFHAHDIGSRIKGLNEKMDSIRARGPSFNFIKLEAYHDREKTQPHAVDRKTDPLLDLASVVGNKIEEDTRALVDIITHVADDSNSVMVVAIVGVGGIGKTTLSKKIFNNEAIQGAFSKKIWLSITQEFNEVDLLSEAVSAIDGEFPRFGGGSGGKVKLVEALTNSIRDKKFFLVLDDMWGHNVWNNLLKKHFSHGAPGSRVLITTRHDTVARGLKAVLPYHRVEKLGPEDAWSLLKKQVLTDENIEYEVDMLKDIGLQIIEKCDGLPLAVKVMGGLLCQREKTRYDWENILNTAIWSVSQMPEELNYAIYLSYEDMPPCLKQCFLHFSLKPKKTILDNKQLVGMWIAEGFIHGDSDRLEILGNEYHKELILRNLIESDTSYAGQNICHMHDVVRSFAQFLTRHEALVAHDGENINRELSVERFLRLSIETKGVGPNKFEWKSLREQKSLRSLIFFGNFKTQPGDSLSTFPSLRTLHVESPSFSALVESLHQLKHLRYLAVHRCKDINSLPENIQNMKFLQHISLSFCENLGKLPHSIVKLQELRYLDLDGTCVKIIPKGFHALEKLRSLWGFRVHMDGDWCSLEELGPLSHLSAIGLLGLENVSDVSFATKAKISEKVHLTNMKLKCSSSKLGDDGLVEEVSENDQGIIKDVFDELCPPSSIEDIHILGYYGHQLPGWMMLKASTSFKSLKIIKMHDLASCAMLPDGLCQLPCLEYLEVSNAPAIKLIGSEFVQPYIQHHHTSSIAASAFPCLHTLIFNGMLEWEEWEWEEEVQAMPMLEVLIIQNCKLGRIPSGLTSHARALKKLTISSVQGLHSLENFLSLVELSLYGIPDLTRISNFSKLQKLKIDCCPRLELLQDISTLQRLVLSLYHSEKELPKYLQTIKSTHLLLDCSQGVLTSMAAGEFSPDWEQFSHILKVEAYADDGEEKKKFHLFYTSNPYNMETDLVPKAKDQYADQS